MAVRIKFDRSHNVIQPTFVLATRSGKKLGVIPVDNIQISDAMNTYFELSFQVSKESDGKKCELWDQIEDFKLVWCRTWDVWFEIHVEISESNNTVKNISAISLGEAELSQIKLHGIEINTEQDIERDDWIRASLYDADNPKASILDRMMEKAQHYTIKHVDISVIAESINRLIAFSFDNISLYDAFQEIAEELNCIFIINSGTNEYGKIAREISVYDLESYCLDCGHRDSYFKVCPECQSHNVTTGYGEDTNIFISVENLADEITYSTDKDSVKNCFKLEGGDDLMTATIMNCNPNGSGYIWYISDVMKRDMSSLLVDRLAEYDTTYDYYQNEHESIFTGNELTTYNALVQKYRAYNDDLEIIPASIIGYPALMTAYYNTIDFYLYLSSGLMPNVEMSDTNATNEANKLALQLPAAPVAVQSLDILSSSTSSTTASNAVLGMAKIIVDSRYQVKVKDGYIEDTASGFQWTGTFVITNYSSDDDTATTATITVLLNDDIEAYTKQKLDKALNKYKSEDATDVVSLFNLGRNNFEDEIKKFGLKSLETFQNACQTCLDILIEQGISNKETWADKDPDLYTELYVPYYNKNLSLMDEIQLRESEIAIITGIYDSDGDLQTPGLQNLLDDEKVEIQDILNFEKFLGHDLWLEFIAYRREDVYSNSNYISDGLNNEEIFKRALKFIEVAKKEIYKSATLQHSITATLKNLLVMKEFAPIIEYFSVGNWIRVRIDDVVYRLRLISYEIDFEDLNNISIEFSDVLKCIDGVSDIESILNQASSMATNYDGLQQQASNGDKAKEQLDNWVERSLELTNMKIVNNAANQGILIDEHGILGREYFPITDTYGEKQIKIFNKGVYLTDDDWLTSRAGIGNFYYYNPMTGSEEEAYGVIADTLIGNLILSEKVGVYNTTGSIEMTENGINVIADATENDNNMSISIYKKILDENNNEISLPMFYVDSNGELVLNGSIRIESNADDDTMLEDLLDEDRIINIINNSIADEVEGINQTILSECADVLLESETMLNDYKTEVGQYMYYGENGLELRAKDSMFYTIIDNRSMRFRENDSTVAYISNKQLNINDAIIRNMLILGNFFFVPRDDKGVSIVWQDDRILNVIYAEYRGGTVNFGTNPYDLENLTVYANYINGDEVIVDDYTLIGEINVGQNTITVEYGGLTTTFNVNAVPSLNVELGEETGVIVATWLSSASYTSTKVRYSYNVDVIDGIVALNDPYTMTAYKESSSSTTNYNTLLGRFVESTTGAIYYIPEDATYDYDKVTNIITTERLIYSPAYIATPAGSGGVDSIVKISAEYEGENVSVGTTLDELENLSVYAHYASGKIMTIANKSEYTLSGDIQPGSNVITVTYVNYTTTFTVVCDSGDSEVTLSSITATYNGGSVPVGTSTSELENIIVMAIYSDGSMQNITEYLISTETIVEGDNTITVMYGGKTALFTVVGYAENVNPDYVLGEQTVCQVGAWSILNSNTISVQCSNNISVANGSVELAEPINTELFYMKNDERAVNNKYDELLGKFVFSNPNVYYIDPLSSYAHQTDTSINIKEKLVYSMAYVVSVA